MLCVKNNYKVLACVICQDSLLLQENTATALHCGHVFHEKCIRTWLKGKEGNGVPKSSGSSCPTCRKSCQPNAGMKVFFEVGDRSVYGDDSTTKWNDLQDKYEATVMLLKSAEMQTNSLEGELRDKAKEMRNLRIANDQLRNELNNLKEEYDRNSTSYDKKLQELILEKNAELSKAKFFGGRMRDLDIQLLQAQHEIDKLRNIEMLLSTNKSPSVGYFSLDPLTANSVIQTLKKDLQKSSEIEKASKKTIAKLSNEDQRSKLRIKELMDELSIKNSIIENLNQKKRQSIDSPIDPFHPEVINNHLPGSSHASTEVATMSPYRGTNKRSRPMEFFEYRKSTEWPGGKASAGGKPHVALTIIEHPVEIPHQPLLKPCKMVTSQRNPLKRKM